MGNPAAFKVGGGLRFFTGLKCSWRENMICQSKHVVEWYNWWPIGGCSPTPSSCRASDELLSRRQGFETHSRESFCGCLLVSEPILVCTSAMEGQTHWQLQWTSLCLIKAVALLSSGGEMQCFKDFTGLHWSLYLTRVVRNKVPI